MDEWHHLETVKDNYALTTENSEATKIFWFRTDFEEVHSILKNFFMKAFTERIFQKQNIDSEFLQIHFEMPTSFLSCEVF